MSQAADSKVVVKTKIDSRIKKTKKGSAQSKQKGNIKSRKQES